MVEVAVKVHQINPGWTENQKDKFIKHVTRDTETHKDISHANIVKMLKIVEIDSHSCGTVLEYCDGMVSINSIFTARTSAPSSKSTARSPKKTPK